MTFLIWTTKSRDFFKVVKNASYWSPTKPVFRNRHIRVERPSPFTSWIFDRPKSWFEWPGTPRKILNSWTVSVFPRKTSPIHEFKKVGNMTFLIWTTKSMDFFKVGKTHPMRLPRDQFSENVILGSKDPLHSRVSFSTDRKVGSKSTTYPVDDQTFGQKFDSWNTKWFTYLSYVKCQSSPSSILELTDSSKMKVSRLGKPSTPDLVITSSLWKSPI